MRLRPRAPNPTRTITHLDWGIDVCRLSPNVSHLCFSRSVQLSKSWSRIRGIAIKWARIKWQNSTLIHGCRSLSDLVIRKGLLVFKVSDRALGSREEGDEKRREKGKMWQRNIMILQLLQGTVAERGCWLFHHVTVHFFLLVAVRLDLTWHDVHLHYLVD